MSRKPTIALAMLRVLADSPDGLSTRDIAGQVPGQIPSDCSAVLGNQARRGRVERVGLTCRGVPSEWRITEAGRAWLDQHAGSTT